MHDTIFSEQEREFKPMTRHTSSIQQTCSYPKRYNMMFVSGSMVLQLNKLHFHHIPSTPGGKARHGEHVVCDVLGDNYTATTNARHGADECKINLHWVQSLIFAVKMFTYLSL